MHFLKRLNSFFRASDKLQDNLSGEWRNDTNRRSVLIIAVVGLIAASIYTQIIEPPQTFPTGELVSIPSGSSLVEVGTVLAQDHVIQSPFAFRILITLFAGSRGAKAGDYVFKEPMSVWGIARAVSLGQFGLEPVRIRIPEGSRVADMARLYEAVLPRFNAQAFVASAQPDEGFLFPDTYYFLPNVRENTVIQTMRQNFDQRVATYTPELASSTHSLEDIVTMASIIEREARNSKDRHMIAGVLWNRIQKGMALQVDVTFLYIIGKNTFQLTTKDLVTDSPYNTYTRKGLPPGPIGSPSLDSIDAALHPTPNKYFFYLADNTGVTHFSKTYQEHLQNKALYLGT